MGIHMVRRVADLEPGFVLAPERYHPRRSLGLVARRRLADYVELVAETISASSWRSAGAVLVLDTTHAYEGFVLCRHDPVAATKMGSAKRPVLVGDVIISRLRPYLRQVALIDEALFRLCPGGNAVVTSTEFFILRGRAGFDAGGLVPFLLSAPVQTALAAGQEGGHHPRFGKELLLSLPVPETVAGTLHETAKRMQKLATAIRSSLRASRLLREKLEAEMARLTPSRSAM